MKEIVRINTISQVHDFFGLDKPKHPLVSVLPINDRMTNFDYGDKTYVMDLYQISLKSGISGSLIYGRNSYDFPEGTMVFTRPNQALKVENSAEYQGSSGWTLMFHPDLIRKSTLAQAIEHYSFFSYAVNEALHLSDEEKRAATTLVETIKQEYSQNIDQHSQELIISNIELLLKYCRRYYDRQFYTRSNIHQDTVSRFEDFLEEYFNSDKPLQFGVPTVKYCGEVLHMSPHYLSDLLKKETGRNAQEHIYAQLIERAKTKLLGTLDSIGQIAYDLGFQYPQHFSKVFKSKTGMSPSDYRSSN